MSDTEFDGERKPNSLRLPGASGETVAESVATHGRGGSMPEAGGQPPGQRQEKGRWPDPIEGIPGDKYSEFLVYVEGAKTHANLIVKASTGGICSEILASLGVHELDALERRIKQVRMENELFAEEPEDPEVTAKRETWALHVRAGAAAAKNSPGGVVPESVGRPLATMLKTLASWGGRPGNNLPVLLRYHAAKVADALGGQVDSKARPDAEEAWKATQE